MTEFGKAKIDPNKPYKPLKQWLAEAKDYEEREYKAKCHLSEYVRGYMRSKVLAARAKEEGWDKWLEDAVKEIAWLQVQKIYELRNIYYTSYGNFHIKFGDVNKYVAWVLGEAKDTKEPDVRFSGNQIAEMEKLTPEDDSVTEEDNDG